MRVHAPAKINLHLRVGAPRADGFHPLLTWMCTVALFDTLDVVRSAGGSRSHESGPVVRLSCDLPGLPCDSGNLVVRAAETFAAALDAGSNAKDSLQADGGGQGGGRGESAGNADAGTAAVIVGGAGNRGGSGPRAYEPGHLAVCGVDIRLLKRIPVGAGLGGGSSDGARALLAVNALWGAGWTKERLAQLSAKLGSDLPFFFYGPSAICRGRGEQVQPLSRPRARLALLILPARPMPTEPVYRRFDEIKGWHPASITDEPDWRRWTQLDASVLLPLLVNDLEPAAFSIDPQLGRLRDDAEQSLSRPVRMSGSGSSLFTLFESNARTEAQNAARMIEHRFGVAAVVTDLAVTIPDDLDASTHPLAE